MQRKVPRPRWRRRATATLFVVMTGLPWSASALEQGLSVADAWIRAAPPGVAMLAGYFSVTNAGAEPRVLVGARSARFAAVELHVSRVVDGVARMRPLERVAIGAGETVAFAPGGRHLMLIRPVDALQAGDCVVLTLLLDDGSEVDVRFELRRE